LLKPLCGNNLIIFGVLEMSVRLNNWKTQLKAEKSIHKIYQRDFNAAWRKLSKNMDMIKKLEDKIAAHLAKTKQ